jgi:SET domain-containing protein
MYLVKTKLGASNIHGTGVFADEFIAKGTIVWAYHEGIDQTITPELMDKQSMVVQEELKRFAYLDIDLGVWILAGGRGCFVNHSEEPCLTHGSAVHAPSVAARDIQPGEELTENYKDYDAAYKEKGISGQSI